MRDDTELPNADTSEKPKRGINRSILLAVLLAFLAIAWVASGSFEDDTVSPEVAASAPAAETGAEDAPIAVRVRELTPIEHTRRILVTGKSSPVAAVEIRAETAGLVDKRSVEKGDTIQKGDVLIELQMADRGAQLRDAQARADAAKLIADASRDLQKKRFESEVKLANSKADLASAQASLEAVRLDIARTRIRAPMDGYLEVLELEPGDYVGVGDHVATVIDLDPLRIFVNVAERSISDVAVGDLASVHLPGGRDLGGTVHFVSRLADDTTRTYRVEVRIDNPNGAIPAGQTAEVELLGGIRPAHIIPPSALTLNDDGELGVRIVDDADTVRFRTVSIIEDTPDGAWVDGLEGTVRLIVVGQEFVAEGLKVNAVSEGQGIGAGTGG